MGRRQLLLGLRCTTWGMEWSGLWQPMLSAQWCAELGCVEAIQPWCCRAALIYAGTSGPKAWEQLDMLQASRPPAPGCPHSVLDWALLGCVCVRRPGACRS